MQRIEALGRISDERGRLTRTFCSPAMRRANDLAASWMREAGMETGLDAIGNLIGRFCPRGRKAGIRKLKTLLLGSHLDTVRDAGKFDGPLGVLIAIACVQHFKNSGIQLPFALEVVGFCDEEGVRFQSTYLGSRALAGTFDRNDLKRLDADGIGMAKAIQQFGGNPDGLATARAESKKLLGYVEVHIEQGPVLENENLAAGVVSAITGQTRFHYRISGRAGHAGTVPMKMRSDALCAAAELILAVESYAGKRRGLVATVGTIQALPGASNVIPGEVNLTLDVRHADDRIRKQASARLRETAAHIAKKRGLKLESYRVHDARSVLCDARLSGMLESAVKNHQARAIKLPSGAGHDAAAMAAIAPVAMLFVRCKGGISHHPDEWASQKDIAAALKVLIDFVAELAHRSTAITPIPERLPARRKNVRAPLNIRVPKPRKRRAANA